MPFKWKDRYKLDIGGIDSQHAKLFEIGLRAYDIAILDDSYDHYDEIMQILAELMDYTEYHFKFEEKLMKSYKYDGYEQHKQEHDSFVARIKEMISGDIDSDQKKALLGVIDFLSEWIGSHIVLSDRQYAVFFSDKGIAV